MTVPEVKQLIKDILFDLGYREGELLEKYPGSKIICVDSLNSCYGQGLMALDANQMKEEGNEELVGINEAFSGEVSLQGYAYKKDFFLGDVVTIQKTNWNGIYINARVIEVIESEDQNGKTTVLTFGI